MKTAQEIFNEYYKIDQSKINLVDFFQQEMDKNYYNSGDNRFGTEIPEDNIKEFNI